MQVLYLSASFTFGCIESGTVIDIAALLLDVRWEMSVGQVDKNVQAPLSQLDAHHMDQIACMQPRV